MNTALAAESEILRSVLPELEAEGYEVYPHPNPPIVPAFLGAHTPDAIALGPDKGAVASCVGIG
jgi:hypothetical protein